MNNQGKLYLISCPLEGQSVESALPQDVIERVSSLDYFLVENAKTARSFLKTLPLKNKLQELEIHEFNNESKLSDLLSLLKPALIGRNIGVLSEVGAPGVADPGANLIIAANTTKIEIYPLVGPSAVMTAIMSSGLNGQNFAFNGYLPIKSPDLEQRIKELEKLSDRTGQAQFFIETPYRIDRLAKKILAICEPNTMLSLSINLGSSTAYSKTKSILEWRQEEVSLDGALGVLGIGRKIGK